MRIAELARRSGFPAATLRYYEEVGVVPPPERTAAGYRDYDERAVERLAFVARAKQLGCSLDEITELARAWDDDECGPVQHRLRGLVDAKLDETAARIAELTGLSAQLRATAAALAARPVDGPCDATCGCTGDAGPEPGPAIACSLGADRLPGRLADWEAALRGVTERHPIPGGVRLVLAPDAPLEHVVRLAADEQGCCAFFSFAVTVDGRGAALEVTAPAEARDVVTALFGPPA